MMTIESVRQEQVGKLRHEFFSPESREERLGSSGRWQGVGARRLGLDNPVRETAFANLLAGRTPDGTRSLLVQGPDPECPAGWRLTFTASQSVSVLWAMAPQASRTEIERVHAQCVEAALIDFEQILCRHTLWAPAHVADRFLGGVFASFRRGAAWDQTPHLHTTVFCMNLGVQHDQSARRFDPHRILETKNLVTPYYHRIFEWGLYRSLGPFRRFASKDLRVHGIPQELCRRFLLDPGFANRPDPNGRPGSRALRGEELFARWSQQGREFGWGPTQAQALLDRLKFQQVRQQIGHGIRSGFLAAMRVLRGGPERLPLPKQSQGRSPATRRSQRSQNRDHGHSH